MFQIISVYLVAKNQDIQLSFPCFVIDFGHTFFYIYTNMDDQKKKKGTFL
jgi:hypothetical protein